MLFAKFAAMKWFLISLFIPILLVGNAQHQSNVEKYVFAIDLQKVGARPSKFNLFLVDEDSNPYPESSQNQHRSESQFKTFQRVEKVTRPTRLIATETPFPLHKYYTVAIALPDPPYPVYQAMLVVYRSGGNDTTLARFEIERAVPLSQFKHQVLMEEGMIKQKDGGLFEPLVLVRGKDQSWDRPDTIQRLITTHNWKQCGADSFQLSSFIIREYQSLDTLQNLAGFFRRKVQANDTNKVLKFLNWPPILNRFKGIAIVQKTEAGPGGFNEQFADFYRWEDELQQFKKVDAWSSVPNVYWHVGNERVQYKTRIEEQGALVTRTYYWDIERWKLANSRRSPLKQETTARCVFSDTPRDVTIPLQYIDWEGPNYVRASHAISITNRCHVVQQASQNLSNGNVHFPASIKPGETIAVTLNDSVPIHAQTLLVHEWKFSLPYPETHHDQFYVAIPFVHRGLALPGSSNGITRFERIESLTGLKDHLEVNHLGQLMAYGKQQVGRNKRVGVWKFWKDNQSRPTEVRYSKHMLASFLNLDRSKPFTIETCEQNTWTTLDLPFFGNQLRLDVFEETSGFRVSQGESQVYVDVDFNQLKPSTYTAYYLLHPDDEVVRSGSIDAPIKWDSSFILHWSPEFHKQLPHTINKYDSALAALNRAYPELQFSLVETTLHAEAKNKAAEITPILATLLQAEKALKAMSQWVKVGIQEFTYFDDQVSVTLAAGIKLAEVDEIAEQFHLKRTGRTYGEMYVFKYTKDHYNREMVADFNGFCNLGLIEQGWLHYRVEYDHDKKVEHNEWR